MPEAKTPLHSTDPAIRRRGHTRADACDEPHASEPGCGPFDRPRTHWRKRVSRCAGDRGCQGRRYVELRLIDAGAGRPAVRAPTPMRHGGSPKGRKGRATPTTVHHADRTSGVVCEGAVPQFLLHAVQGLAGGPAGALLVRLRPGSAIRGARGIPFSPASARKASMASHGRRDISPRRRLVKREKTGHTNALMTVDSARG